MFDSSPDDLDMHVIYDVSHNIAKIEQHMIDGKPRKLLVHRKGSTRAFPPHHPLIPVDYQWTGQPVLIGGTMGTCSYVLTGTAQGMKETFGSTCHGAGRAMSRAKSRRKLQYEVVLESLRQKGISIRVASPKLVMEEAPESYKVGFSRHTTSSNRKVTSTNDLPSSVCTSTPQIAYAPTRM